MADRRLVTADHVWKRYCRTMRRSVRYALTDGIRSFVGLPPATEQLREDEFWSLSDISFALDRGESLAVIGSNGAGKSTLLKILSGVIAPDRGQLRVRGRIVSMMMAGVGFHPVLTGRENIHIYGSILGLRRREVRRLVPAILEFADLTEFLDTPVKYYSTGMYMRLAFAIAAQSRPDVFVIDEVLAVGDVAFRTKCIDHLQAMKRDGCALLLVSHSAGQLRSIADHGLWLHRGACLASGPIEEVLDLYLDEQRSGHDENGTASPAVASPSAPEPPPLGPPSAASDSVAAVQPWAEITRVQPPPGERIEWTAHTVNRVSIRVHTKARCLEPVLTIAFESGGAVAAAGTLTLSAATFPQPQPDRTLRIDLDVCPRLRATDGEVVVRLLRPADDGTAPMVVEERWPCRIDGRPEDAGAPDLREEFGWRAATADAPPPSVAQHAAVPIAVPAVDGPRAWLLLDDRQRTIVRTALPPAAGAGPHLAGTFHAHLPAGDYQQAIETAAGVVPGARVRIQDAAEPVGHADLEARGDVVAARPTEHEAAPSDTPIHLTDVRLEGSTPALDGLLGASARLSTRLHRSARTTTVLAAGERCRLLLSVRADRALVDWDVSVGFGHPERGRCAGMRLRRASILGGPGELVVCFEFAAHLARGEYVVGCSAVARDTDGRRVEAHVPEFASCLVLGPHETGSEGRLEILRLEELPTPPTAAPPLCGEAADLSGTGLRLVAFALDGRSGVDRTVVAPGSASVVEVGVVATTAVDRPSFKFAFVSPTGRCVARMTGFEAQQTPAPLAAGSGRTWRMEFVPRLAGGRYQVQVALLDRSGGDPVVTDRRHQGAVCLVPARLRASGPGLLDVDAVIDVE